MKHERWRAILAAQADIDKLVAAAVGDFPAGGPPRAGTARPATHPTSGPQLVRAPAPTPRTVPTQETTRIWREPARAGTATGTAAVASATSASVEYEALHRLHIDVHARIEALRATLGMEPGVEQAMLALVLFFDERVMGKLPEYLATSWPLLQTRLTGRKTGGADFFRLIDRMLDAEAQPALVFEVYYYCLSNGFQGQYADDLASLDGYKQKVAAHVVVPEPARQASPVARAAAITPVRSPWLYYVAAGGVIVLVAFLLTLWTDA